MGQWMDGYLQRLDKVGAQNLEGGGKDRLEVLRGFGKLTARERIDRLVDAGSFEEIGSVVEESLPPLDGKIRPTPADGIVMGYGEIDGRTAMAGIFYRRSGPDEPFYVEKGDKVEKKQVISLLETMKVFQKIKSPASGTVVEILVDNEKPVIDEDLMFIIEKN